MNDMLVRILAMDKLAREQAREAEESKKKAFDELSALRSSLIEQQLAEAKTTVEALRVKQEAQSRADAETLQKKQHAALEALQTAYRTDKDRWIDLLVEKALQ